MGHFVMISELYFDLLHLILHLRMFFDVNREELRPIFISIIFAATEDCKGSKESFVEEAAEETQR